MYRVTHVCPDERIGAMRMWISEAQGFSPIRFEIRVPTFGERPDNNGDGWDDVPHSLSEVTWIERSGVWVPVSLRVETNFGPGGTHRQVTQELAFDWESVNEPVDDELFTALAIAPSEDTELVDMRLGEPVSLGTVGQQAHPVPLVAAEGRASLRWVIAAAVAVAVAGLGLVALARHRANRLA
jgi:hypothetical protein